MLLLTSAIVFTARIINYSKSNGELSEIKSFGIVKQYFNELYRSIFKSKIALYLIFCRILSTNKLHGEKSVKKGKKTTVLILEGIKISQLELEKLAS